MKSNSSRIPVLDMSGILVMETNFEGCILKYHFDTIVSFCDFFAQLVNDVIWHRPFKTLIYLVNEACYCYIFMCVFALKVYAAIQARTQAIKQSYS